MNTEKMNVMLGLGLLLGLFAVSTAAAQERVVNLSLPDCLSQALRDNLNLKQYDLGLRYSELSITRAQAAFDPTFSTSFSRNESETPNFYQYYNVSTIQRENTDFNITYGQTLSTGGSWGAGLYSTLSSSNIETVKNYTSNLGFQFDQPLLRGFGSTVTTSTIYFARIDSERARNNLEQQAIALAYEIDLAYWNLVYARETLRVHEISISQADSLLAYNQKGLDLGLMTESDVLEARSALASRRQEALNQQNTILSYEDQLRRLLNFTSEEAWDMTIVPTDRPSIVPVDTDPGRALETAFQHRPDYLLLRQDTEQNAMNLVLAKNQLKPDLNFSAGYRLNGSGQTIGKNFSDLGDADAFGWSMGLVFNYPLGNRAARTSYAQREIDTRRAELRIEDIESQIRTDIRTALRNIQIARERIDAAALTVEVNELKLKIEEERFRNQLSSSYYVLQFQSDLANSRNLYNRALVDHVLAVSDYQRARGSLLADRNISIIPREQ